MTTIYIRRAMAPTPDEIRLWALAALGTDDLYWSFKQVLQSLTEGMPCEISRHDFETHKIEFEDDMDAVAFTLSNDFEFVSRP